MTRNSNMIPTYGTLPSMVEQLQSISDAVWEIKDQVSVTCKCEPRDRSLVQTTQTSSTKQISEDWREVNTFASLHVIKLELDLCLE